MKKGLAQSKLIIAVFFFILGMIVGGFIYYIFYPNSPYLGWKQKTITGTTVKNTKINVNNSPHVKPKTPTSQY
ncbi:MAG: hypothetical protein ACYDAS_03850 [Patescibacteria group bacterium]